MGVSLLLCSDGMHKTIAQQHQPSEEGNTGNAYQTDCININTRNNLHATALQHQPSEEENIGNDYKTDYMNA